MRRSDIVLTGKEIKFGEEEVIVSKTDLHGVITYANDIFIRVSGYSSRELIGAPHSILRHPEMPRCVFKALWDTIQLGKEIFAYVNNMTKNGDFYWVFAHVTPSFDSSGNIIGYHSNRRVPYDDALPKIKKVYSLLSEEERKHSDPRKGLESSYALLANLLQEQQQSYDQFVMSLSEHTKLEKSGGLEHLYG
jgi:PAS domain S-box-containing protein